MRHNINLAEEDIARFFDRKAPFSSAYFRLTRFTLLKLYKRSN